MATFTVRANRYGVKPSTGGGVVGPAEIINGAVIVDRSIKKSQIESMGLDPDVYGYSAMLVGFDIPASLSGKKIDRITLHSCFDATTIELATLVLAYFLPSTWNIGTVIGNRSSWMSDVVALLDVWPEEYTNLPKYYSGAFSDDGAKIARLLENGLYLLISESESNLDGFLGSVFVNVDARPPYLLIDASEASQAVTGLSPSGTFVDKYKVNRFYWVANGNKAIYKPSPQVSVQFRWRMSGASGFNVIHISSGNQYCDVPAGTFPKGTVEWQAIVTYADGKTSVSAWTSVSTTDAISGAAIVSPNNMLVNGMEELVLRWNHVISTGTAQKGFEIQYSKDGAAWSAIASKTTADTFYALPSNSFSFGNAHWRVRTYNSDGIAGTWSQAAIVSVINAPPQPAVSAEEGVRPIVSWMAEGQVGYQVKVNTPEGVSAYDSGPRYGTEKEHKVAAYLGDGSFDALVRVQNNYGLWSEWGFAEFISANQAAGEIILSSRAMDNEVCLSWDAKGAFIAYYVYRDGNPIARTEGTTYIDRMCVGKHRYRVRGVAVDDFYSLSAEITEICKTQYAAICRVADEHGWTVLSRKLGSRPTHTQSSQAMVAYNFYAGRRLPVVDIGGGQIKQHIFSFTVSDSVRNEICNMLGEQVVYKDCFGAMIVGILETQDLDIWKRSEIEFSITETDYAESIEYDV